jgi:DNA polymerase elongation subunit (family B)
MVAKLWQMRHTDLWDPVVRFCMCVFVLQSVTAYGRAMIEQTKQEVEQRYSVANGYQNDAQVDSVSYSIKDDAVKT